MTPNATSLPCAYILSYISKVDIVEFNNSHVKGISLINKC